MPGVKYDSIIVERHIQRDRQIILSMFTRLIARIAGYYGVTATSVSRLLRGDLIGILKTTTGVTIMPRVFGYPAEAAIPLESERSSQGTAASFSKNGAVTSAATILLMVSVSVVEQHNDATMLLFKHE